MELEEECMERVDRRKRREEEGEMRKNTEDNNVTSLIRDGYETEWKGGDDKPNTYS